MPLAPTPSASPGWPQITVEHPGEDRDGWQLEGFGLPLNLMLAVPSRSGRRRPREALDASPKNSSAPDIAGKSRRHLLSGRAAGPSLAGHNPGQCKGGPIREA